MQKYNPKKIESKWQKYWEVKKTFVSSNKSKKKKKYVLIEFPYPSGAGLHMGHVRPYVAGDVYSRYMRLRGFEVMYPMGWDAFGLPAENFAIKHGIHPSKTTAKNILNAKRQVKSWGVSFDWSREVNTTDPLYYKWTQWLFLQFYKKGLAYEATGPINWCPKDKTGLANEEVVDGKCERCGTVVEKKELRQWFLKITAYAQKLLDGLKDLEWPEQVKSQQENWIGRSTGALIKFPISNFQFPIEVFTTRPDTIFGVTYLVVAPEHVLIQNLESSIKNYEEVSKYIESVKDRSELDRTAVGKEKTGVELKGIKAVNPANGEELPVWCADYVLGHYGTGAVMAVPAHDERDFGFAKKHGLPIRQVVLPIKIDTEGELAYRDGLEPVKRNVVRSIVKHWSEDKYLILEWKKHSWKTFISGGIEDGEDMVAAAKREVTEETGYKNLKFVKNLGSFSVKFYAPHKEQNRDDIHNGLYFELVDGKKGNMSQEEAEIHNVTWVDKSKVFETISSGSVDRILWQNLCNDNFVYTEPGKLMDSGKFTGMSSEEALLKMAEEFGVVKTQYRLRDWLFSRQRYWGEPIPIIHCEACGIVPVPEKDLPVLLPNVKKYEPTGTGESPLAAILKWVNVKCPKCKGKAKRETNTMPQWAGSSWYFLRYVDPKNKKAFADKKLLKKWMPVDVYFGGMEHTTLHLLYSRFWNLFLYDQKLVTTKEPYAKRIPHGIILAGDGEKMSKSRGNVVNPDDIAGKFGADSMRMYELFLGPHELAVSWNDQGVVGVRRFLEKVWGWVMDHESRNMKQRKIIKVSERANRALHKLIRKVGEDIEAFRFNTAVSSFMEFYNDVKDETVSVEFIKKFLTLLYPFAPHISEELNLILGGKKSMQFEVWPKFDARKIVENNATIVVQVNGKVRESLIVPVGSDEGFVKEKALALEKVKMMVGDSEIRRVIFVVNRIINFVV